MKKLTGNIAAKIASVILSYIMVLIFVFSACTTFVMCYYKFYFSNQETVTKEILGDMLQNEIHYTMCLLADGTDLKSYYKDKNVFYDIKDLRGTDELTDSNYNGEKFIVSANDTYYIYKDHLIKQDADNSYYETEEIAAAEVNIYVAENMTKNDRFSVITKIIEIGFKYQYAMIFAILISLIGAVVFLCFSFCATGHTSKGEIKLNYLDKLPIDIYLCAMVFAAIISIIIIADWPHNFTTGIVVIFFVGSIDYFLALGFFLSVATRIKTQTLIKNSLIYRLFYYLCKGLKKPFKNTKYFVSNLNLVKKTILVVCCLVIFEFIILSIALGSSSIYNRTEILLTFIIILNLFVIAALLYIAVILQKIRQGGEKIAAGDLEHKIDTEYMFGDFKSFSESLNNINDGLQTAVNERMKSERFKTELITNVSHDIKTPLTSIINYVDLIKKEEIDNETVKQYIEVLDRQSGRLKKLVEDLVEASKASSGSLPVQLLPCNVGVLLTQSLGEFEDRLNKAQVQPVLKMSNTDIFVLADGRHLWRVFDNLLNNVSKYALEGTRVYIDAEKTEENVKITFRNISKYELNVSSDELFERFVRGDKSRNTEGSGLGLSIAKSLVEIQGGILELSVDGDLFKVTITFGAV